MPHRDALVAAQARIAALESRLDELQAVDEAEADRLNALQEECERLSDALDDSEAGSADMTAQLDTLEGQLEAFGVPKDFVDQVAAVQAAVKKAPPRKRTGAWYRKRPRTFGLVALGVVVGLAAVAAAIGAIGLNPRGVQLQAIAHVIGAVLAARLVYTGVSRWADPSLGVVTTSYAHGRTASGENVSIATGTKERHYKPTTAMLIAGLGLVVWLLIGGAGAAVTRGWILGPSNFLASPPPPSSPTSVGRVRSR